MAGSKWDKWLPSSKMTAVGIAGTIHTLAVALMEQVYEVVLHPVDATASGMLIVFVIGYAITEQRGGGRWNH